MEHADSALEWPTGGVEEFYRAGGSSGKELGTQTFVLKDLISTYADRKRVCPISVATSAASSAVAEGPHLQAVIKHDMFKVFLNTAITEGLSDQERHAFKVLCPFSFVLSCCVYRLALIEFLLFSAAGVFGLVPRTCLAAAGA